MDAGFKCSFRAISIWLVFFCESINKRALASDEDRVYSSFFKLRAF